MKLILRQKMISLFANYTAKTEEGQLIAEINQKLRIPASFNMIDASKKLTYTLKGEFFKYEVLDENQNLLYTFSPTKKFGLVLSKRFFNFIKKELQIFNAEGVKIGTLGGNWLAYSYKLKVNNEVVAIGKKSVTSFTDKYKIEVLDESYADLALIGSVLFDASYNQNNKGNR